MRDDEEICLCFHVTLRKVVQFIRVEKPTKPSQLSECYGAGTGCGWCRPFLERLLEETNPDGIDLPNAENYASERSTYRKEKGC
jgi:NAD(P)H-nitrite reductase large subunit